MADVREKLKNAVVGIAGLGGLGSNVAAALARFGPGRLIIADFDTVEEANLDRQQYFFDQIGVGKVDATVANLRRIRPDINVTAHELKLSPQNIPEIFADAQIIAECFDHSDQKQMLVETVLTKMKWTIVVSVSGIAGYGRSNDIKTRRISKRHVLVGDDVSQAETGVVLTAARVGIAACHQANAIIELIIDEV